MHSRKRFTLPTHIVTTHLCCAVRHVLCCDLALSCDRTALLSCATHACLTYYPHFTICYLDDMEQIIDQRGSLLWDYCFSRVITKTPNSFFNHGQAQITPGATIKVYSMLRGAQSALSLLSFEQICTFVWHEPQGPASINTTPHSTVKSDQNTCCSALSMHSVQVYGERRRALLASDLSAQMVEYAERTVDDVVEVGPPPSAAE